MSECADAACLSPEERLAEIATILANGILRLRQRTALPAGELPEYQEKTGADGPAIGRQTRLSGRVG